MSARPGGNEASGMARAVPYVVTLDSQAVDRLRFCRGCRYLGKTGSFVFCDFAGKTGRPRTVRNGIKVELCPRKRKGVRMSGGVLEDRLCRIRDAMKATQEGRRALAEVIDAIKKG